jgi:hypothetical protein
VAIGQVATIRQSYESKIAAAPPSDQQLEAVTDQCLSVGEYNSIIRTAQNDPRSAKSALSASLIQANREVVKWDPIST